jgi:hypothetical protein
VNNTELQNLNAESVDGNELGINIYDPRRPFHFLRRRTSSTNKHKMTTSFGATPLRSRAEKKVLQNLAREIKIRELEDENREHKIIAAATQWDASLEGKDRKADQKRYEKNIQHNLSITNQVLKEERRKRLEQLFKQDELRYEAELQAKGLAYRRERV